MRFDIVTPNKIRRVVTYVRQTRGIRNNFEFARLLGVEVNLQRLLVKRSIPEDREEKMAFIKVYNWTVKNMLEIQTELPGFLSKIASRFS